MIAVELSGTQLRALQAVNRLGAHEDGAARTAWEIAAVTGQAADKAAYTLRSLVTRGLADCKLSGTPRYWLTAAGLEQVREGAS